MQIAKGLEGVVVDTTSISLVDGERGILSYRGHNVDTLVDLPFGEVAALVVDGHCHDKLAAELIVHSTLSERDDPPLGVPWGSRRSRCSTPAWL